MEPPPQGGGDEEDKLGGNAAAPWSAAYVMHADNVLAWSAAATTDAEFMAFLERVDGGTGFVWGLHPLEIVADGKLVVRQKAADLKAFFVQLRRCMGRRADLDGCSGELYLLSARNLLSAREPRRLTKALLERSGLVLPDGVWGPDKWDKRPEGRVRYDAHAGEILYRDKAFLFSNFGDHFDVCLNQLVQPEDLPHVPFYLRMCRFRSVEFIIQGLTKLVNAQVYPAQIRTEDERRRFNEDCDKLNLAPTPHMPRLTEATTDDEADRAVAAFNQALVVRVCLSQYTTSDAEVKYLGRRVRLSPEYFALASGREFPQTIAEGFGLNARIQALGFLLRIGRDAQFKDLCLSFLDNEVAVGEAAAYIVGEDTEGGAKLVLDTHWAGDLGYSYAPHQGDLTVNGERPYWHDAMAVGYLAAQAVLCHCERGGAGEPLNEFLRLIGQPATIKDAVRMLIKSVLLDRKVDVVEAAGAAAPPPPLLI